MSSPQVTFLCVAANALTHTTDTYSALSVEKLLIVVGSNSVGCGAVTLHHWQQYDGLLIGIVKVDCYQSEAPERCEPSVLLYTS